MGKQKGRHTRVATLILILCAMITPSVHAAPKKEVLRVCFPTLTGFSETDAQGNRTGYTYEYLMEIAQYTGWDYEFITPQGSLDESLKTALEQLERGEADLIGGLNYTEDTAQKFDYPGISSGTSYSVLATLSTNTSLTESNYQMAENMRIAVLKQAVGRNQKLEEFCNTNQLDATLVYCASDQERLDLLYSGQVDAVLWVDVSLMPGMRSIAKFSPQPFYFATTKGNTDIVNKLNTAIMKINESDPFFAIALHEKHFGNPSNGSGTLSLTDEELAYVHQAEPLRVVYSTKSPPLQYTDALTGEFSGLAREVFNYIEQITGLRFTYVGADSLSDAAQLLSAGKADLVAGMAYSTELSKRYNLALSRSYFDDRLVMVVNKQTDLTHLEETRLVLPVGVAYEGADAQNAVWYDSTEACVTAVAKGQADYTYGNGFTLQFFTNQMDFQNLTIIPQPDASQQLCIGVVKPVDVPLLTLLNKAILSIPERELQSIIYKSTGNYGQPPSFSTYLSTHPVATSLLVAIPSLLVILSLSWALWTRARFSRTLAAENGRYKQLYELSGEYIFEYNFEQDCMILTEQSALVFGVERIREHYWASMEKSEDPAEASARQLFELFLKEDGGSQELLATLPDGSTRWFRVVCKIIKDMNGQALFCIGKLADIQEEKQERIQLEERAQKDSLTGAYNAAACRKLSTQRLDEGGKDGALLLIDIDHFKQVNDKHGHYTGDQVLVAVTDLLTSNFRREDIVGRPGGDEFLVFMPYVHSRSIVEEKCRALLKGCSELRGRVAGISVTLSIGVTMADECRDYDTLYRRADKALYAVKHRGRNGYGFE